MKKEINTNEAYDLMKELLTINSVNPPSDKDDCAKFIVNWLKSYDIQSEIYKVGNIHNVIAKIGKKDGKSLLWNGHYDTVPFGEIKDWKYPPLSGMIENEYVYGRGASDMKSGILSMMLAMKSLKKIENEIRGELIFMISGDEETGSNNGTKAYLKNIRNKFTAAMVSEPTNLNIEIGNRGLRWLKIEVEGRSCHAGRPFLGKNAVEHAAVIINELKKIELKNKNEIFEVPEPHLSITMINGGIQENVIPNHCSISIDRRLLPGETEESICDEINNVLKNTKEDGFRTELTITNKGWDPYLITEEEEIFKKTAKAYVNIMKQNPNVRGKGGCTDASHIYKYGIPVVIFGPGDSKDSHTVNEKVNINNVVNCAYVYKEVALDYLK